MAEVLMGIDLGTTAAKVGLFDAATGSTLAVACHEYQAKSLVPGWLELHVAVYWEATVAASRQALAQVDAAKVLGIGLSSQGQTFTVFDAHFRPLRPAIVWLDTRAEQQTQELRAILDADEFGRRTLHPFLNTIDAAPKILWVRQNEPEIWKQTRYIMLLPDYLGWQLTGQRRIDLCNAGSTAMVDNTTQDWWPEALDAVGVPRAWLSPIGRAGETIGTLRTEAAEQLGITTQPEAVVVALGSNDQLNGAVGAGNVHPGIASVTVGTALAVVTTLDRLKPQQTLGLVAGHHPVPGLYYLMCYAKTSGVLLTWLRELIAPGESYEELLNRASQAPAGCDGLVCLPHFSGTAMPTFDSSVRGGFVGLSLGHRHHHIIRAVCEAVCFVARDAVELMAAAAQRPCQLRMLGGATRSDFWMQMMADVMGLPLEVAGCSEAAVLGGAVFAGVAAGRFVSIAEAALRFYHPGRAYEPSTEQACRYREAYQSYHSYMERLYPGALGLATNVTPDNLGEQRYER